MLEAFEQFIFKNHLCKKEDKILIAISGGIDSIVMLDLFHLAGYEFAIAHCNFKLRGIESDQDEEFVRKLAEKYNAVFYSKTCNASAYAANHKCSIQEAARELRYQWFTDICNSLACNKIAVAQHADDQTETFFINLLRGSGVAGLKSIPLMRGKIIRPLLFATRNEIIKYASERKLSFREDSSNSSGKYLRNKIRHQLLPHLEKVEQDYRRTIVKSIKFLNEDYQLINDLIEEKRKELFSEKEGITRISIDKISTYPDIKVLLFYLLKEFGFSRDITNSICKSLKEKSVGKHFYADKYHLLIDREFLLLKPINDNTSDEYILIHSVDESLITPLAIKTELVNFDEIGSFTNDLSTVYFELEKLNFPLIVRKWRKGDRFIPFGMKGSKLVSDFLIDQKIDRFEKENVYVLESENKIIWLIGYRRSDYFKVSANTSKVIKLNLLSK